MVFALFASQTRPTAAQQTRRWIGRGRGLITVYATVQVIVFGVLALNHLGAPIGLEPLEGAVVAQFQQLWAGQPLYPAPTAQYVPLVYNPLFYYLSWPIALGVGPGLLALRLTALLGTLGSALVLMATVHRRTGGSIWWGWVTVGLFLASYQQTAYCFDMAQRDSWLLLTVLLGCYCLDSSPAATGQTSQPGQRPQTVSGRIPSFQSPQQIPRQGRSKPFQPQSIAPLHLSPLLSQGGGVLAEMPHPVRLWAATLLWVAAFWIKQPGAIILGAGLLYFLWQWGWRRVWVYGLGALLLGPIAYGLAPWLGMGSHFHIFTWQVPLSWADLHRYGAYRLVSFSLRGYGLLAIGALGTAGALLLQSRCYTNIWVFLLPFVLLEALVGAFDPAARDNVFLLLGVWFILLGLLGLRQWSHRWGLQRRWQIRLGLLMLSFGLLAYNPIPLLLPADLNLVQRDFLATLRSLKSPVFAPWWGQESVTAPFLPLAHGGALADWVRGDLQRGVLGLGELGLGELGLDELGLGELGQRSQTGTAGQAMGQAMGQRQQALIPDLLKTLENPSQTTYLVALQGVAELAPDSALGFLRDDYELVADWGDRFRSLATLSPDGSGLWPRYLFRSR